MHMVLKSIGLKKEGNSQKYNELDDNGVQTVYCRPVNLNHLTRSTKFTKKELQIMYRGFKQECPNGMVREQDFKLIFNNFFSQGDSASYVHYVFATFDQNNTGYLTFAQFIQGFSVLLRGNAQEKLKWIFELYDIKKDGVLSLDELMHTITAVYELMGKHQHGIQLSEETALVKMHAEKVFRKLDRNRLGVVSLEDFLIVCSNDPQCMRSLNCFDTFL